MCKSTYSKGKKVVNGQDGETGVDFLSKSTYSKGRKVVLGRMERHVLIWSVKALTQKARRWS